METAMRFTLKDAKIKTTLRERIPFHYNEPDPERHLSIWDSNPSIKSIRSFSESQREKITCVGFSFTKDFPIYIAELKRFPNLRELIFNDCYWVKPAGTTSNVMSLGRICSETTSFLLVQQMA
jgi:hypothetical protein